MTYCKFFPSDKMTKNEQLNALTRFSIYIFIILILFSDNVNWMYLPIFIFVLSICLSKIDNFESFYNSIKHNESDIKNYNGKAIEKNNKINKNKCIMPTINNPFMNVLMSDYNDNMERPVACDPKDSKVKKQIEQKFHDNLQENDEIIFDQNSSINNYYTMPVTSIPNKQKEFAEWLYDTTDNCKTKSEFCLKNSDIRYHKNIY